MPSKADRIALVQGHIARIVQFADAAEAYALLTIGNADVVGKLRAAWIELETAPLRNMIEAIKNEPTNERPPATAETLIGLVDARDKIESQIDALKRAQEKVGENVPGLAEIMEATMLPILQQQREYLDAQITEVQGQLEKQEGKP
jgi:hypothetical protein